LPVDLVGCKGFFCRSLLSSFCLLLRVIGGDNLHANCLLINPINPVGLLLIGIPSTSTKRLDFQFPKQFIRYVLLNSTHQ
jgi:hypothetical protein